jgi:GAF domain-containing protein
MVSAPLLLLPVQDNIERIRHLLRSRPAALVFLGAVPVVLGLLAWSAHETKVAADRRIGFTPEERNGRLVVASVRPGLPADRAGVRVGDVLLEVAGRPVRNEAEYDALAGSFRAGWETEVAVERSGHRLVLEVTPGVPFPWLKFLGSTLTVLAYLAVGVWALRRRPGVLKANLLAAFCGAVALELVLPEPVAKPALQSAFLFGYYVLTGLQLGLELHLAATIPERRAWLARRPWIVPALYGVGGIVALVPSVTLPWGTAWARGFIGVFGLPAWCLIVTALLLEPVLRSPDREGRRDAGIVLAGTVPWSCWILISAALEVTGRTLPAAAGTLEAYAVLCFPLGLAAVLYRESARQEAVVLGLGEEIQRLTSLEEISGFVRAGLEAAFHPRSSFLFRREALPPDGSELLRFLERRGGAVEVPEPGAVLPPEEAAWLESLRTRLLVPLFGRDRDLVGLLALGEKKSEEPYTARDRRVLQTIAGQIALVIENTRLHERVEHGRRVQREVLDRLGGSRLDLVKECPRCGGCFGAEVDVCPRDGAELAPALPVERTIAGRYRLERLLGRGGMGAVYEAFDEHLRRPVAVKILLPALFGDAEALRRFEREARISARLQHPNIVAVHDFGGTETGGAFLVMELLNGVSLRTSLQRNGSLDPPTAARWFRQICAGVRAAHESRVIHRDLKPENLFIARMDGEGEVVKVLDFGLAKAIGRPGDGATSVTVPGTLLGTVSYMSPEQWNGQEVDERSDVFALGVIAFETISGDKPFRGSSPAEILHALLREEVRLPGEGPEVRHLEAVLRRCLAKYPRERFARVEDLEREILPALEACPPLGPAAVARDGEETRRLPGKGAVSAGHVPKSRRVM